MGKCEECLHIDVCEKLRPIEYFLKNTCSCFQNKADVVEVRHGYWIDYETDNPYGPYEEKAWYKCSECEKNAYGRCDQDEWYSSPILSDYCPFCGAKMDGKDGAE